MSKNNIASVRGLEGASRLQTLALAENVLNSLDDFPILPDLHTINVVGNRLGTLAGLEQLPKLWNVYAAGNPLSSAEAVRSVRTRGGNLDLPPAVADVALAVNRPRPLTDSRSFFVIKLPDLKGTKRGLVTFAAERTGRYFEYTGKLDSLSGAIFVNLLEGTHSSHEDVTIEMQIASGRVRVYLTDGQGYRYVEATAGRPARLTGGLMLGLGFYTVLEAIDSPAAGLSWHVYRR